jgi:hypothetical protein
MQLSRHSLQFISTALGVLGVAFLSSSSLAFDTPVLLGEVQIQQAETDTPKSASLESSESGLSLSVVSETKEGAEKPLEPQLMKSVEVPEPSFMTTVAVGAGCIIVLNHWRRRVYR